jgi:adenylate cyclase
LADIFVSYANEDRARIEPLVSELETAGYSVWWDRHLKGGTQFSAEIESELKSADVVLVAWSPNAVKSRWVADEADLALETGNLLPISLDGTRSPMGFRQLQTIDFSEWTGGEASCVSALLDALTHHVTGGARTPNEPVSPPAPPQIKSEASIAVLPFACLSSDSEQGFFADGIVEDLITALSRFPWLFVISRGTSFSFKGKTIQASQLAADLGIRYIVEGSVRMSPSRLRVTVQLIDAQKDRQVWAENYDRPTGDLFDLQDEITQTITGVLVPALSGAEREHYLRESHPTMDAWAAYQKGLAYYYRPYSDEDHAEARRLFDQSVQLDPNFADAHAMVAMMGVYSINSGQTSYTGSQKEIIVEARLAADRAAQLDDSNALAHVALGQVNQLAGQYRTAILHGETAIKLNPNLAIAHHELGYILTENNRLEESIQCFDRAIKLSPNDPSRWNFFLMRAIALYGLGKFDRAIVDFEEASRLRPAAFWPFVGLAAVYVAKNRMEDAQAAVAATLERNPDWTIAKMSETYSRGSSKHSKVWLRDLRKAGLPEE